MDRELSARFGHLKSDPRVIYPMAGQLRLLVDAFVAGEGRIFGLESLASDPLFVHLAGGVVPSLDTVYTDLERLGAEELAALEGMVAAHGLSRLRAYRGRWAHFDLDTTVCPHDSEEIEGALPGPNPKYHGRPSLHPILARIAELGTVVGAQLRPGDRGLGVEDAPLIRSWVRRAKEHVRKGTDLCVRIDAGGDCAEILAAIHAEESFYVVKARITPDLFGATTAGG
ncbi:MAG: transposase [Polyangiaceae bacterium]